jgi:hypothetical protein
MRSTKVSSKSLSTFFAKSPACGSGHCWYCGLWRGAAMLPTYGSRTLLGAFSKLAFWSVFAIVISGIYTAYNGLEFDLYHLLFSAYGRTLIAKVAVFAAVLAIGGYKRYWLVPKVSDSTARFRTYPIFVGRTFSTRAGDAMLGNTGSSFHSF